LRSILDRNPIPHVTAIRWQAMAEVSDADVRQLAAKLTEAALLAESSADSGEHRMNYVEALQAMTRAVRQARFFQNARLPSQGGGFSPGSRLASRGGGFFGGSAGRFFETTPARFTPSPSRFFPTAPPRFTPDAGRFSDGGRFFPTTPPRFTPTPTRFFPAPGRFFPTPPPPFFPAGSVTRFFPASAEVEALADAIKRGQAPELLEVLRKVL
jgi:hypothetical protein